MALSSGGGSRRRSEERGGAEGQGVVRPIRLHATDAGGRPAR